MNFWPVLLGILVGAPFLANLMLRLARGLLIHIKNVPKALTVWVTLAYTVLLVTLFWGYGTRADFVLLLAYSSFSVVIVVVDVLERRIPNRAMAWGYAGLGLLVIGLASIDSDMGSLIGAVVSAAIFGTIYLLLAVIRPAGLGMGDVKYSGLIGLVLGYVSYDVALLGFVAGFAVGALFGLAEVAARKRVLHKATIPFGPAMTLGAFIALWINVLG